MLKNKKVEMIKNLFKIEKLYVFNKNTLTYENFKKRRLFLLLFLSFVLGMIVSYFIEIEYEYFKNKIEYKTKYDHIIGTIEWKDSVFSEYEKKANFYLIQDKFKNTPIKGSMLALAARNAYDSTGILVPLELALAQAQWESDMGRKGRSPVNNPFNIGEWESGTVLFFESTFEGIQAYYYLMCKNYLRCKTLKELFKNFTNCVGNRYATISDYENIISIEYYKIKKWLEKNYKRK